MKWIDPNIELPAVGQDVIALNFDGEIEAGFYSEVDKDRHAAGGSKQQWCDFSWSIAGWIPRPDGP